MGATGSLHRHYTPKPRVEGGIKRRRVTLTAVIASLVFVGGLLAPPVASVGASRHTVASVGASRNTVMAWGWNLDGPFGTGTSRSVPVAVSGLSGVKAISAGSDHSLALLKNGTVMAWGQNDRGQLGNGTNTSNTVPVAVSGLSGVKAIAAGGAGFSLALLKNGMVMAWGANDSGQLGNGSFTSSNVPVAVSGLSHIRAIAAGGGYFGMALRSNGTVWTWGGNDYGQLGNGSTTEYSPTPAAIGLSNVTAIAAGDAHALALTSGGTVMAWGYNEWGQLGIGTFTGTGPCFYDLVICSPDPVAVSGLSGVKAIAGGAGFSLALLQNGMVMAWGANETGYLGIGTNTNSDVPATVIGLYRVRAIAACRGEGAHSLALLQDGTVMAWGANAYGELGNGTYTSSTVPVVVSGLSGVKAISAGSFHSLALSH